MYHFQYVCTGNNFTFDFGHFQSKWNKQQEIKCHVTDKSTEDGVHMELLLI